MAVALYKQLILVKWQPAEATLDPAAELLRLRRQNRKSSMGTRGFYEYDMSSLKHKVFILSVKLQPLLIGRSSMWRLTSSKWQNIIFWIAVAIDVYLIHIGVNKGSGLFLTIVVGSLIIAINLWRKYGVNWWQELQEKQRRC